MQCTPIAGSNCPVRAPVHSPIYWSSGWRSWPSIAGLVWSPSTKRTRNPCKWTRKLRKGTRGSGAPSGCNNNTPSMQLVGKILTFGKVGGSAAILREIKQRFSLNFHARKGFSLIKLIKSLSRPLIPRKSRCICVKKLGTRHPKTLAEEASPRHTFLLTRRISRSDLALFLTFPLYKSYLEIFRLNRN